MNFLTLMGNLGADPEVRFTSSGQKVTTLRLADNDSRRTGAKETNWWRVTLWGEKFDGIVSHLKKGSAVIVIGDMEKPQIYTDREGRPQISLNMTAYHVRFPDFMRRDRREEGKDVAQDGFKTDTSHPFPSYSEKGDQGQGEVYPSATATLTDDDIPF